MAGGVREREGNKPRKRKKLKKKKERDIIRETQTEPWERPKDGRREGPLRSSWDKRKKKAVIEEKWRTKKYFCFQKFQKYFFFFAAFCVSISTHLSSTTTPNIHSLHCQFFFFFFGWTICIEEKKSLHFYYRQQEQQKEEEKDLFLAPFCSNLYGK